jgi:hypothetical protein
MSHKDARHCIKRHCVADKKQIQGGRHNENCWKTQLHSGLRPLFLLSSPAMFIMRILRFLIGFALIPICFVVTRTAFSLAMLLDTREELIPTPLLALGAGFFLWQIIFFLLSRPVRTYVLAHELTHAIWGLLMGARVSKMKISKDSGSVVLSKTNFLITLAPYFFPLYTVIIVAAYFIISQFYNVTPYYLIWLGLVGFTWGFHVSFTITTLMQQQSDIQAYGHLFSYAVIYIFNIFGICLWIVLVTAVTFGDLATLLKTDFMFVTLFIRDFALRFIEKKSQ